MAELTKALDDAKWRLDNHWQGEFERSHKRVGELEAEMTRKDNFEEQKRKLEWRLGEMTQWWNDAKWRWDNSHDMIPENAPPTESANWRRLWDTREAHAITEGKAMETTSEREGTAKSNWSV